jgi:chromosome segregation ATPase
MRSEFASVRIAAAKKDGDLQELRREITALREAADRKQRELEALRTERDNLLQVKNEFHVQLAELPDLRLKVAHASSNEAVYQARLQDIESALAHLTRDIYGLTAPRQTALEETAGGALQTRIKELESGMAMFLAEWEHFKTDWAQTKIQSKPAVLEPAKKEPEQAAPSKPRKAKTSGP